MYKRQVYGYERVSGIGIKAGFRPADVIIVDLGVFPRSELLSNIVTLGPHGGALTDEFQRTCVEGIYACGGCAELKDASLEANRPIPTPDVSYKSGMIAGYNAGGLKFKTVGYVKKIVASLFDLEIASIGATKAEAERYGVPHYAIEKHHERVMVRLLLEKGTERLIGVQMIGPSSAKLAEWAALAIRNHLTAPELAAHHLDLSIPVAKALSLALDEAIK